METVRVVARQIGDQGEDICRRSINHDEKHELEKCRFFSFQINSLSMALTISIAIRIEDFEELKTKRKTDV